MIIPFPAADAGQCAVGRRLRDVREARGLTLEHLAGDALITPARLRLAEHGRTRLTSSELHALIISLHISLGLLFEPLADVSGLRRLREPPA